MNWIKKLLIPNRYDCFGLVFFILVAIAFYTVVWTHYSDNDEAFDAAILLVGIAICLYTIGSVVALDRHSRRRSAILLALCLTIPPASYLAIKYLLDTWLAKCILPVSENFFGGRIEVAPDRDLFGWIYCGLVLIPIGSWILFSAFHTGSFRMKRLIATRFRINRSRLLIIIAGSLLVLSLIGNIVRSISSSYGQAVSGVSLAIAGSLIAVVVFGIATYLPIRFLLGRWAGWLKCLGSLLMLSLITLGLWFAYLRELPTPLYQHGELWGVIACVSAIAFFLLCVASLARSSAQADDPAAAQKLRTGSSLPVPSIWGAAGMILLAGLIWLPFRYELLTLYSTQDLELARAESRLRWQSKGQLRRSRSWGGIVFCDFDKTTPADVFAKLGSSDATFVFSRSAPQVDFGLIPMQSQLLGAQFDDGVLTTRQLNDFLSQPARFIQFAGCEVVESGTKIAPHSIVQLYFTPTDQQDHQLANILSQFESFENVSNVVIQSSITSEDWNQIVRASEQTSIQIMGGLPNGVTNSQLSRSNANIRFSISLFSQDDAELDQEVWRWLTNSNALFELPLHQSAYDQSPNNGEINWIQELIFAFPNRLLIQGYDPIMNQLDLDSLESLEFVFDRSPSGDATGLWLPFGEANPALADLTELKILSFDETWLQPRGVHYESTLVDLSALSKLERLSFSTNLLPDDVSYLATMKSLKHLQIPMVDRSLGRGLGFDSCPSLETITLFGKPDAQAIAEFQRLPNLKRLTIVDLYEEFVSDDWPPAENYGGEDKEKFIQTLVKRLPDVQIEIVADTDFEPEVPDSFRAHVETRSPQIRKHLEETLPADQKVPGD